MLVQEYGVWDKLLFGTDYPVTTVTETIGGLRGLCDVQIDRFSLPREQVERLIHRDALGLLGLPDPRRAIPTEAREPDNRWRGRRWREP